MKDGREELGDMYTKIKRGMDIVFSGLFLLAGAIPLLVVALLVKIDSKGPALFKQERLGKDGKPFWIYKFRSMVVGAEKTGSGVYSGKKSRTLSSSDRSPSDTAKPIAVAEKVLLTEYMEWLVSAV